VKTVTVEHVCSEHPNCNMVCKKIQDIGMADGAKSTYGDWN